MVRIIGLRVFIILVVGVSAVYVANIFVYLTPPNPVKAQWLPVVTRLAHPLFAQNWHLFAPDPVRMNHVLTVRCRLGTTVTAWHDLTKPMLARHHRTRMSPMSRLLRVHQNAIRLYLGWTADEWRPLVCRRDPRSPACRGDGADLAQEREMGAHLLRRSASLFCDGLAGRGRTEAVQMRVLIHQPPFWSRRDRPDSEGHTRFISLPWMAYQPR